MAVAAEDVRDRIEHFKKACALKGIKLTHQRLEVFKEVARSTEHPDAESIYRKVSVRIPTISRDTVYRNLKMFEEMELVSPVSVSRNRMRFDANTRPHHHFVCTQCGLVRDFYSSVFEDINIPKEVEEMGDVSSAYVELRGLCSNCKA